MPPNHPNRGRGDNPARNPKPAEVRAAREAAGLTQTEAGAVVFVSMRGWQQWEAGERPMHPAFWELFRIKLDRKRAGEVLDSMPTMSSPRAGT